jgi:hypothetical protein
MLVIKIKENEMGRACSTYGEKRNVDRFWWGNVKEDDHWKTEVYIEDNIKVDVKETGWQVLDWIYVVRYRKK